jgi:hypothetical protein
VDHRVTSQTVNNGKLAAEGAQKGKLVERDVTFIYQQFMHSFSGMTLKQFNNTTTTTKFLADSKKVTHSFTFSHSFIFFTLYFF